MIKGTVINIRGSHSTGKTTAVRDFIKKHNNVKEETIYTGKYKSKFTIINNDEIVVFGTYSSEGCCGCDKDCKGREHLLEMMSYTLKKIKPKYIIYEGILYGTTFKLAQDVHRLSKIYGYSWECILLYRPLSSLIKLIEERNKGADYDVLTVESRYKSSYTSTKKLKEAGYKTNIIQADKIEKENMYKILSEVIYGKDE